MTIHYTYKGTPIDMGALMLMNEHAVALGNANMNARGDVLGRGGKVVRTVEAQQEEWQATVGETVVHTAEADAVQFIEEPKMETFDAGLLTGYDAPAPEAEPVVEAPRKRRAPTSEE